MKELSIEDKELVLKDLSARLLYGVMIQHPDLFYPSRMVVEKLVSVDRGCVNDDGVPIEYVRSFLRSMDDMTKEELETYHSFCYEDEQIIFECGEWIDKVYYHDTVNSIDYLNLIHVDYRGLIEKGLAIAVTEENNPYKSIEKISNDRTKLQ